MDMNATNLTLNPVRSFAMQPAHNELSPASLFALTQPQSANHSLFAQLRSHFPTGALISELVQVHEGQFVVRVLVQVGNTTLATGMAAADRVEVAEDRARVRAMEVLGIAPASVTSAPASPPPTVSSAFEVQAHLMAEAPSEPTYADVDTLKNVALPSFEPQETEEKAPPKTASGRRKKDSPEKSTSTPIAGEMLSSFPSLDLPAAPPEPAPVEEIEYAYTADFEADLPNETAEPEKVTVPDVAFSSTPIDLSDAIAQIGTEIERIGWTKKQGSTYLQQTYGKKTRAELTEDELLEFLHYLKALPSKGHPSLSQIPF
jgi:hypothetical protein